VNRRRERRWQSSQDRARVAAELIEEAESLTETAAIASPVDVALDTLGLVAGVLVWRQTR